MACKILFAELVFAGGTLNSRWCLGTRDPDRHDTIGVLCVWVKARNFTARIIDPWHLDIAILSDGFGTGISIGSTEGLLRPSISI